MVQTEFEMIREKFKEAQAERNRELEQERKIINKNYNNDDDIFLPLPREKNTHLVRKLKKLLISKKS